MISANRISAWRRSLLVAAALILIVSALAACGKKDKEETVIATYKGGTVTDTEFTKYTTFYSMLDQTFAMYIQIPEAKEQYLKEYVGYKLLYGRANDDDKKKADQDVDTFVEQYETAIKDNAEMKKAADDAGLTADDVRSFYHQIVTIRMYWDRNVTDADLKAEYEANKGGYNLVSVRHILIATVDRSTGAEKRKDEEALKLAKEVKAKLDAGGDWKALASEFSDDEGSKAEGGLYADASPNSWVEEFKKAAIEQPIGAIGEPVKTQYGYHIMKVEKRESKKYEELNEEQKTAVKTGAINAKMNGFMTKELTTLIEKIDLPKDESAATDGSATDNGAASGSETDANKEETKDSGEATTK